MAWYDEEFGTPPRRRGGSLAVETDEFAQRNTPVSAGRTASGSSRAPRTVGHPRVGEEDVTLFSFPFDQSGTPPRR
ncbi:predicted protein [Streptomyces viridosporus ATCC 14672]|uniref:Predicted protein n=1 Tax=Streptomyces viridosporus (strain ATCC 14672 / DSM 40746 / JCM 4963 / KCTC 9882 / NRRL B-12104 / FH 1290) TaxID=566461 RepID=D5ZNR7_STRV1|nr:predicted protein [Streptomyces viridosporus ATCC 14672]